MTGKKRVVRRGAFAVGLVALGLVALGLVALGLVASLLTVGRSGTALADLFASSGLFTSPVVAVVRRDSPNPGCVQGRPPRCPHSIGLLYADGRETTPIRRGDAWPGTSPGLSPDGEQLAFATSEGLFVVETRGDGLRRLMDPPWCEWHSANLIEWTPDGETIAVCEGERDARGREVTARLVAVDVETGARTVLATLESGPVVDQQGSTVFSLGPFRWSPDGKWLAYRTEPSDDVWIVRRDGSEERRLVAAERRRHEAGWAGGLDVLAWENEFAWSPDSRGIAYGVFGSPVIYLARLDGSGLQIKVPGLERPSSLEPLMWDDRGTITFRAEHRQLVATTTLSGAQGEPLFDSRKETLTPAWLADEPPSVSQETWLSLDGRAAQWWRVVGEGACLMSTANRQPQVCVDLGPGDGPEAIGERRAGR